MAHLDKVNYPSVSEYRDIKEKQDFSTIYPGESYECKSF